MKEVEVAKPYCKMLYRDFHLACPYYEKKCNSLTELVNLAEDKVFTKKIDDIFIYYIIDGTLRLSYQGEKDRLVPAGHLMLLPIGIEITAKPVKGNCSFITCRMRKDIHLCLSVTIDDLYWEVMSQGELPKGETSPILEANKYINDLFDYFVALLGEGVRCCDFIENKLKELMLLLRIFYPKEVLAGFFSPLLSGDALFKRKILEYYPKAKSIEELASLTNYSLNGFLKKFKKNIGETPSQWIKKEKAGKIHKELVYGEKPLKQIAEEYGFTSISYFNQFCKKKLGDTPGKIRAGKQ